MYEANIQKQYLNVFEGRLQQIKPQLDLARQIISLKKIAQKNIYISGECAAWLIGRTDTFEEVNVFLLGEGLASDSYREFKKDFRSMNRSNPPLEEENLIIKNVWDWPITFQQLFENQMLEFPYTSTPLLKFVLTDFDIHEAVKHLFNFPAISVFINLFDTNEILTAECRCNYESHCRIIHTDCMSHSRVVYPLLLDNIAPHTFWVYHLLEDEEKENISLFNTSIPTMNYHPSDRRLHGSYFCPQLVDRMILCARSMVTDPYLYPNRIMSFCEYSCSKCKDRDKLTRKYADIWWHKTYAPDGYAYKAAARRFKGIDTVFFKEYCTCD